MMCGVMVLFAGRGQQCFPRGCIGSRMQLRQKDRCLFAVTESGGCFGSLHFDNCSWDGGQVLGARFQGLGCRLRGDADWVSSAKWGVVPAWVAYLRINFPSISPTIEESKSRAKQHPSQFQICLGTVPTLFFSASRRCSIIPCAIWRTLRLSQRSVELPTR